MGFIIDNFGVLNAVIGDFGQQRIFSCLEAMDALLGASATIVSSVVLSNSEGTAADTGARTLLEQVAHFMGLRDLDKVDEDAPLSALGFDSMVLVDVKNVLDATVGDDFTNKQISALTIRQLREMSTGA